MFEDMNMSSVYMEESGTSWPIIENVPEYIKLSAFLARGNAAIQWVNDDRLIIVATNRSAEYEVIGYDIKAHLWFLKLVYATEDRRNTV
jgi:hypothetical protein